MAQTDLNENPFRDEIFEYLIDNGYSESKKADYDIKNAFDTEKVFEFLEMSQSDELNKFKGTYPLNFKEKYIELLSKKIESRGLLKALKEWVEDYASGTKFSLVYFKPNLASMNESQGLYEKNIFSVRRELAYEDKADSCRVDLALFINGIPIIMIELKKQTAGQNAGFEGTKQFREDRNPNELIFKFNQRTLAYFTIDEFEAFVTTKLDKKETSFLPFNKGSDNEGAGNPVVEGKHSTCYLWEEILQKDMMLRIIREFMFIDNKDGMVFPRYHQLDAVLKLERHIQGNGIGSRYLIWHSAGSGKTKTISWLSRRLINHNEINSVIVISDRTVIDNQLADEAVMIDGKTGVVKRIDTDSKALLKALNDGGNIIVTTLQKFRPILDEIKKYEKRKYAIIIDEAHSSTAGKSMSKAVETLSGKSLKDSMELDDSYEELEDEQNQILKSKHLIVNTKNVSYFAFTATPKNETMELFGTRAKVGKTYFHKYSMKQAIEEGFILNPLSCYSNYTESYKIKKIKDDPKKYESGKAQASILNFVTTSEEVIETKTRIMIDDFIERRIKWLDGKAKVMIVTPSRKHAVCYKLAIDKYLAKKGCGFKSCVAFTGTIEMDGLKYTENEMNKAFSETDLKALIKNNDDLRIIIVADKLQTGFDENRLCIMYVDKKLGSAVKAVQTLSRINRPAENKKTFILDFVNKADEIKEYFEQYYGGALFLPTENECDPNVLFAKRDLLLDYFLFTHADVEKGNELIANSGKNAGELTSLFGHIKNTFNSFDEEKQKLFLAEANKFIKLYFYISTVHNSWNEDLRKVVVFLEIATKVLQIKMENEVVRAEELVAIVDYSAKKNIDEERLLLHEETKGFDGVSTEVSIMPKNYSYIDELIEKFNTRYAGAGKEFSGIVEKLSADDKLIINVKESSQSAYEAETIEKVAEMFVNGMMSDDQEKSAFYAQISGDKEVKRQLANAIIRKIKDELLAS